MKQIMIVSPHGDDEILGLCGYMIKEINKGNKVFVLYTTPGGHNEDEQIRLQEINNVSKFVGFEYEILYYNKDGYLNEISDCELISKFDEYIEKIKPNELYWCYNSHHQDHQKLYKCMNAATRLKESFNPEILGLYEYPFINNGCIPKGGLMYIDISNEFDKKIKAFQLYKSQNKKYPSPLNIEAIEILAKMRGMECGCKFAELIYIKKIVK